MKFEAKKSTILKLLLLNAILLFVILSFSTPYHVSAQNSGLNTGFQCVKFEYECPSGSSDLYEELDSLGTAGDTKDDIMNQLWLEYAVRKGAVANGNISLTEFKNLGAAPQFTQQNEFGNTIEAQTRFLNANSKLCISNNRLSTITGAISRLTYTVQDSNGAIGAHCWVDRPGDAVAGDDSLCTSFNSDDNTTGITMCSSGTEAVTGLNASVQACCPSDMLVAISTSNTSEAQHHEASLSCCFEGSQTISEVNGVKTCRDAVGNSLGLAIPAVSGDLVRLSSEVEYTGSIGANDIVVATTKTYNGSNAVCPTGSTCTVLADRTIVPIAQLNTSPAIRCNKCYSVGEAIRISDDQNNLIRCGADGTGETVELINDSVEDTIVYYNTPPELRGQVLDCRSQGGVPTAIGCVDTTPLGIITGLIRIAYGIMGGVALIQLIIAGVYYQMGDEAKVKEAREKVISTILGIAVLTFSVLILRIIGINILDVIPIGSI